jgi:hypothetical protein
MQTRKRVSLSESELDAIHKVITKEMNLMFKNRRRPTEIGIQWAVLRDAREKAYRALRGLREQ